MKRTLKNLVLVGAGAILSGQFAGAEVALKKVYLEGVFSTEIVSHDFKYEKKFVINQQAFVRTGTATLKYVYENGDREVFQSTGEMVSAIENRLCSSEVEMDVWVDNIPWAESSFGKILRPINVIELKYSFLENRPYHTPAERFVIHCS